MSIKDQLKEETKDFGGNQGGGLFYNFQEGDNKIRVLTKGSVIGQHFLGKGQAPHVCYGISEGCPFHYAPLDKDGKDPNRVSTKYVAYVLDRNDNKVKLADLPYTVISKIGELQEDSDYAFEDFPMPYDIKVTFNSKNSPSQMYSITPSPRREEVIDEIMGMLADKMGFRTPSDHVKMKKEKQLNQHKTEGKWLSPDDIAKKKGSTLSDDDKDEIRKIREGHNSRIKEEEINPDDIPF